MRIRLIDFGLDEICKIPERIKFGDCGYDCYARESVIIPAHSVEKIPLGFGMIIPEGYTAYMHNRSGTFLRGLIVSDALIDLNYRGEIHAIIANITDKDIKINKGERPCSLILIPNMDINWINEDEEQKILKLLNNERKDNKFNSSGK